jgi:hypothetical protein
VVCRSVARGFWPSTTADAFAGPSNRQRLRSNGLARVFVYRTSSPLMTQMSVTHDEVRHQLTDSLVVVDADSSANVDDTAARATSVAELGNADRAAEVAARRTRPTWRC